MVFVIRPVELRNIIEHNSHHVGMVESLQALLQGFHRRYSLPNDEQCTIHQPRP